MEFISREAAIKAVNDRAADFIPYLRGVSEMIPLEIAGAIVRVPSAEVRPVVHGKWKPYIVRLTRSVKGGMYEKGLQCSLCNYKDGDEEYAYCPNCGAKMDPI